MVGLAACHYDFNSQVIVLNAICFTALAKINIAQ